MDLRIDGYTEVRNYGLTELRLTLFKELLELSEKYKRKNQYG